VSWSSHSKAKQNNNQIMGLLNNHSCKIIIIELKMVVLAAYDSIQFSNNGFFPVNLLIFFLLEINLRYN